MSIQFFPATETLGFDAAGEPVCIYAPAFVPGTEEISMNNANAMGVLRQLDVDVTEGAGVISNLADFANRCAAAEAVLVAQESAGDGRRESYLLTRVSQLLHLAKACAREGAVIVWS